MIWVDFVIIAIIALSAVISLVRGFVRETISLGTWIGGFWVAWNFFQELADQMHRWISVPSLRLGTAFAILLLAALLIGGLLGYLAGQLVDKTGLSGTDRLIGVFFGIARGAVLVTILVLLAGLTPLPFDPWWSESLMIPRFQEFAVWFQSLLPPDIADNFRYA